MNAHPFLRLIYTPAFRQRASVDWGMVSSNLPDGRGYNLVGFKMEGVLDRIVSQMCERVCTCLKNTILTH